MKKKKYNHHNRRPLNTLLQCVLSSVASSADVIYGRKRYASINLFAAALCLFLSKKLSREIEKKQCLFYSRWGDTTEHIQLHIYVSGINVNSVSRTLRGKHKPPCIVRFYLLCRAAFFHIFNSSFSEVRIIAIIVFYIIMFLLIKRSFED